MVVVPWERSGAGRYRVSIACRAQTTERDVTIAPAKIEQAELELIIGDLETRLAPSITMSLQRMGAFAGMHFSPPGVQTLAAELNRLRVAIQGDNASRGLASLVPAIARDPHGILRTREYWTKSELARRPSPSRLPAAFARPLNLTEAGIPLSVVDQRFERTVDVYENQILKLFVTAVTNRLRRIQQTAALRNDQLKEQADELQSVLRRAVAGAQFLAEVSTPRKVPQQLTMVLLKRPEYRAMLAAYQRYLRHVIVVLDDSVMRAPLSDVPSLYELWGTTKVAEAFVEVGAELGYEVMVNHLVRRRSDELRLVMRGASVRLEHPVTGAIAEFSEQPSYGALRRGLRSISFLQQPDIGLEVRRPGAEPELYVFDPKYKLQPATEPTDNQSFRGGPVKEDIDKMHAYRDAIRAESGSRVVRYAAILYPAATRTFTPGLEAIECRPAKEEALDRRLRGRIRTFIDPYAPAIDAV
jgi:hypothetical protein